MPHTECAHRQAQTQISNEDPPSSCSTVHLIRPMGPFLSKTEGYMRRKGFTSGCSLYRHQTPFQERISTTHHNLYPQFGVQSRNVNSSTFVSLCPFVSLSPSLQVSVFKVPVLKSEPLFLPLAPFLIVKVNVSALQEDQGGINRSKPLVNMSHVSVDENVVPVQTRQWSSWAPRASGTTSCTLYETSMTVSSEPWQIDTEPWCPESRKSNKPLSLKTSLIKDGEGKAEQKRTKCVLPPGSRRWRTESLLRVSGKTLWSQNGVVVCGDGRARLDMGSSSGIAFSEKSPELHIYTYPDFQNHHKSNVLDHIFIFTVSI